MIQGFKQKGNGMPNFMYTLPDFDVFLILIAFTMTISIIFIIINKKFIYHKLRYKDNTTISSISALIGIIYGVLVGFLCLYLITNQDHASQAVQDEANALENIFIQSTWMKQPYQGELQHDLLRYIDEVVNKEWQEMNSFIKIGLTGDKIILKILDDVKKFEPQSKSESIVFENMSRSINELSNARHARILLSYSVLAPELWEVIILGTILIIAVNYAFRVSLYLHLFGTFTFAIMAASMLFLLVTLDTPFQGEFAVTADSIKDVANFINSTA